MAAASATRLAALCMLLAACCCCCAGVGAWPRTAAAARRRPHTSPPASCTSVTQQPVLQAAFAQAAGANWTLPFSEGWTSGGDPCCWRTDASGSCITWYGLTCAPNPANSSALFVVFITWWQSRFPDALCDLCGLTGLSSLDSSGLVSGLPDCLAAVAQLEYLATNVGMQATSVPAGLASLPHLTVLYLYGNVTDIPDLSGAGAAAGGLVELGFVGAGFANGTLPAWLAELSSLEVLVCIGCGLSGGFPPQLRELTQLQVIELGNNDLSGSLPDWFDAMSNLTVLSISSNRLSGTLPASLGRATNRSLININLAFNEFDGALLYTGSQLASLNVENNRLSGTLPFSLAAATQLTFLSLANNQFTGTVPLALMQLTALRTLDLSYNKLRDFAPGLAFGAMPSLQSLSLAHLHMYSTPLVFQAFADASGSCSLSSNLMVLDMTRFHLLNTPLASLPSTASEPSDIIRQDLSAAVLALFAWQTAPNQSRPLFNRLDKLVQACGNLPSLATLRMASRHLHGLVPSSLFLLFPFVQTIYLQDNDFYGDLPASVSSASTVRLPSILTTLNLNGNDFTGSFPDEYVRSMLMTLHFVGLQDTNVFSPMAALPFAASADWQFATQYSSRGLVCPRVTIGDSVLELSASFYAYSACVCARNYFGQPLLDSGHCAPVRTLCHDGAAGCASASRGFVTIARGFWPSPTLESAVSFVPCPRLFSNAQSLCNPTGQATCVPVGLGVVWCNSSLVCAPHARGRLCAGCDPNFYRTPAGCSRCLDGPIFVLTECLMGLWLTLVVILSVRQTSARTSPDAAVSLRAVLLHAGPSRLHHLRAAMLLHKYDYGLAAATLALSLLLCAALPILPRVLLAIMALFTLVFCVHLLCSRLLGSSGNSQRDAFAAFASLRPAGGLDQAVDPLTPVGLVLGISDDELAEVFLHVYALMRSMVIFMQLVGITLAPVTVFLNAPLGALFGTLSSPANFFSATSCPGLVHVLLHISIDNDPEDNATDFLIMSVLVAVLPLIVILLHGLVTLVRYAALWLTFQRRLARARTLDSYEASARTQAARRMLASGSQALWFALDSFAFVILFALYFFVASMFFLMFACIDLGSSSYLRVYPSVLCNSPAHRRAVVVTGCMFALYTALLVRFLFRSYRDLAQRRRGGAAASGATGDADAARHLYGTIAYSVYKPHCWAWETVLFVKRLAMVMCATFLPPYSQALSSAYVLITATSFAGQVAFMPYRSAVVNALELSGIVLSGLGPIMVQLSNEVGTTGVGPSDGLTEAKTSKTALAVQLLVGLQLLGYVVSIIVLLAGLAPQVRRVRRWFMLCSKPLLARAGLDLFDEGQAAENEPLPVRLMRAQRSVRRLQIRLAEAGLQADQAARRLTGVRLRCEHELSRLQHDLAQLQSTVDSLRGLC